MILQSLNRCYERLNARGEIAPEGFESREIPFVLVIDAQGKLVLIDDTRSGAGKQKKVGTFRVPHAVGRSSTKVAANLLWDTAEYVVGLVREGGNEARVLKQHAAFKASVGELLSRTPDDGLLAVQRFLDSDPLAQVQADPKFEELRQGNPNLAFRHVNDAAILVCQRPAVIAALAAAPADADSGTFCLARGESDTTARLHPAIKGVWGAQTAGANVVSFNLDAFNSYGKTQSYNAPVGEKAAFAYTSALNHLLRKGSRHRFQVGDASTVFWAEEGSPFEDTFAALFGASQDDDPEHGINLVRDWLSAPATGVYADADDDTRFHVLGLAPNAARIAVRFWQVGPVHEFAGRIRQHFSDIAIVAPSFEMSYLPLWRLLASTALKGESKNVVPNLAGDTMHAILAGTDYPAALLQAAIRRCRAEQSVPFARAAVIKACLNRRARLQSSPDKELHMSLDLENRDPAYRLGRLFAALERIQATAQPGINATIRERYYGAASSAPASVFPILLRLKNHHLAKLDSPGLKGWYEKLLGEVFSGIGPDFPRHLDIAAQGRFAIGYYHQAQDFYTRKTPVDSEAANDSIQGD